MEKFRLPRPSIPRRSLVMISAHGDDHALVDTRLALDRIDDAMFAGDAARPIASKVALQRFRLADTVERRATRAFDQFVDPAKHFYVVIKPVKIVIPSVIGEMNLQVATRT